jgi:pyridoxal 5'-phosphate synthase pdxS subunit
MEGKHASTGGFRVSTVNAATGPGGGTTARSAEKETGTARVKRGMAEMLKGGVIMDVVTPEQAKVAEDAGAVAVMALERVPADIRAQGGVARMSDPDMVDSIINAVSIPVMAKCRIGHFVEAQVLQAIGVDYIDESEVLTPADEAHHVDKWNFTVPFVCGATNLGEALRRIAEGAAMIRSKGEAGTGNVIEATRHMRSVSAQIRRLSSMSPEELFTAAKELQAPYDLVAEVARAGKLPVARRRGDDDAARRRGRVRRLGDLQVRRPGQARRRDRQGHDVLRRPERGGQGLPRARRGDGRHQPRYAAGRAALRRARLVTPAAGTGRVRSRHRGAWPA